MTETEEAVVLQTPYSPQQARQALAELGQPTAAAVQRLIALACAGHTPQEAGRMARAAEDLR